MPTASVLRAVVTPGATYSQIENGSFENTAQKLIGIPAGGTQPLFAGATQYNQSFRGDVTQLASLLAECPTPWGKDLSAGNVDLYFLKTANLGTRASGSNHSRYRCVNNTCMYWTTITASQSQAARASVTWQPIWLGSSTPPVVSTGTAAAPSTMTANEYFGLSKVVINGSTVTGITGWTLNTGISREVIYTDGAIYPAFSYTNSVAPTIQFTLMDLSVWSTFADYGTTLTDITLYLQRYKPNATGYYAVDQSQHIAITAGDGLILNESVRGGRNKADTQITVQLVAADSATDVLVSTTGQTIT